MFRGTSKRVQTELLDIMLDICKDTSKREIIKSDFLAVIADNTTGVSNFSQNIVIFRNTKKENWLKDLGHFVPYP